MTLPPGTAVGEDGDLVPVVQFRYPFEPEPGRFSDEELGRLVEALQSPLRFAWGKGPAKSPGMVIRLAVACWVFLPELREGVSQTALARLLGVSRQDLNKFVKRFRGAFPQIRFRRRRRR